MKKFAQINDLIKYNDLIEKYIRENLFNFTNITDKKLLNTVFYIGVRKGYVSIKAELLFPKFKRLKGFTLADEHSFNSCELCKSDAKKRLNEFLNKHNACDYATSMLVHDYKFANEIYPIKYCELNGTKRVLFFNPVSHRFLPLQVEALNDYDLLLNAYGILPKNIFDKKQKQLYF